jgi:hypothetical protein
MPTLQNEVAWLPHNELSIDLQNEMKSGLPAEAASAAGAPSSSRLGLQNGLTQAAFSVFRKTNCFPPRLPKPAGMPAAAKIGRPTRQRRV